MTQAAESESERQSFESKFAALEEAFRGLPIKRAATPGAVNIYELIIPVIVRQLLVMGRGSRPRLSAKEEKRLRNLLPVVAAGSLSQADLEMLSRRPRPLPTKKGLHDLEQSIGRTLEALDNLSQPALDALKETMPDPFLYWLKMNLSILRVSAQQSKDKINVEAGAPEKVQISHIARAVGRLYFGLTEKKPTESNKPFVTLLGAVYDVLGFQRTTTNPKIQGKDRVSAQSQAKALADEWEAVLAKIPFAGN
jgi:hypothetical protein